jgi:hypothetical protein
MTEHRWIPSSEWLARRWTNRWPPDWGDPNDPDNTAEPLGVSPVIAYVLHRTLGHMATTWTTPDQPGAPAGLLPRTLCVWALDDTFTAGMAASARRVAHHLTLTEDDRSVADATVCTADEINIAIAIRMLRRDGARPNGHDPVLDELIDQNATSDPDIDPGYHLATALELARDELVDDIDVDHLWNPALDGIENDTALQHHWRMTNLHPTTWFDLFRPTR